MAIPFGTCSCGCGNPTRIATENDYRDGTRKGQPVRYVRGHHRRKSFIEYVEEDRGYETPCWIWQKAFGTDHNGDPGHGSMFDGTKMRPAHIVYYERKYGEVENGKQLHHKCEAKLCVNPDHLEPLTAADHVAKRKTTLLTPDDVLAIRRNVMGHTKQQLASIYGVSVSNIKMILLGRTWKNIS